MYFDYIKERENADCLFNDLGFVIYKIANEECFIRDIYVKPEFRNNKTGSNILDNLVSIAKDSGCTILTAREYIDAKQTTHSLKCALAYGFQIHSSNENFITILKRI